MPFQPSIAIVGAGPAGLALGQLLHQRGIQTTIYELRAKPTAEELAKPSGMLDLHEESGLTAIRECGLWEAFQAAVGDCTESMRVLNKASEVVHADEGELSSRPEISRNALTQLLIQNLPEDTIKWNHKITAVHKAQNPTNGATEITLDILRTNTTKKETQIHTHDLLIGADGAWSHTRPLLSPAQPLYTGAQYLTATLPHASTSHPHLSTLAGSGSLIALGGDGNALMTQRGARDSIRVYAAVSTATENWAAERGFVGKSAWEVGRVLLCEENLFAEWAPQLKNLLSAACEAEARENPGAEADVRGYYKLPVVDIPVWNHVLGVTLVGDAAHLMTPWGGEGVNLALWDSLDLARVLGSTSPEANTTAAEWQAAIDTALQAFETEMWARAQEKAEETERNQSMFLGEGGAEAMKNFFGAYAELAAAATAAADGDGDGNGA